MLQSQLIELRNGLETAFIDQRTASSLAYKPQFVSNNHREGKKVLSYLEDELLCCDQFQISVAFITMGGVTPLLQTLKELEQRGIRGQILTTNYLNFSEPRALEKLNSLSNITLRMFDVDAAPEGFHTKGYIFKQDELYRIIIGSSNMTSAALTSNREWNTRLISTEQGEVAQQIVEEYEALWNSPYTKSYDACCNAYQEAYRITKKQREIARQQNPVSMEAYKLKPNGMQVAFISNLKDILAAGKQRALLISATGTGKTYASAFAMRELGFRRVLFLVHRGQLAKQTKRSYERVFGQTRTMGLLGAGHDEYDREYVFATVQTLSRKQHLEHYRPDAFDCIILDEAHHSAADTYQVVMEYFQPKLWLGMTATPDKRDDDQAKRNIYEIFQHQIAYEIRLQQALEENFLCPFHYFGISDITLVEEKQLKSKKLTEKEFRLLTSEERVRHIIHQAEYYGYSGERVKGLIFCSRIDESEALSQLFNEAGYRTIALNGSASEEERAQAFERLAMEEGAATRDMQPLDYIFSVEILNEGVDIVEVNQVIMLRPTESPIVFIQQLGRGLRKAPGKEYVVVLDFIGNYNNNFMIPMALSGDRTYNPDTIRKYVISGNTTIPGASTIHFDEIAKEKIFHSIDKMRGIRSIIRQSYVSLKNRLGRIPYLIDFYENGEMDPLVIIREYKTYQAFLEAMEKELFAERLTTEQTDILEYLSRTILSGTRPYELEILNQLLHKEQLSMVQLEQLLQQNYGQASAHAPSMENAIDVLGGQFTTNEQERARFENVAMVQKGPKAMLHRSSKFAGTLSSAGFYRQVADILQVGLRRYREIFAGRLLADTPFVLYEKYSRRDVCLLMNYGRDISSTMYGMRRLEDDVFIFVTYHKEENEDQSKNYVEGKPDYADAFEDAFFFRWDSQIGRGVGSTYMQDVTTAKRKHLLVKKSDNETSFYYMGLFDVVEVTADKKKDNNGRERDIAKVLMKMRHGVRDDLLRYFQSNLAEKAEGQTG